MTGMSDISSTSIAFWYSFAMGEKRGRPGVLTKFLAAVVVNAILAYAVGRFLPKLLVISPGLYPHAVVGVVLAVTNLLVVPILHIIALPIRLFATAVAFFAVNILGLYVSLEIVKMLSLEGVTLAIEGGVVSWLLLSLVFGLVNGGLRKVR